MKNYKEFEQISLGASDVASLTIRSGSNTEILNFGEDAHYWAYLVTEEAEIGPHYEERLSGEGPLWIFDDDSRVAQIACTSFTIYRAGQLGCIIVVNGFDESRSDYLEVSANAESQKDSVR